MRSKRFSRKERGFTLVELSIVLIIIGLIVSGILVGQDLIESAQIRATIGQVEQTNTAVNTFRLKYGDIPGDAQGTQYGLGGNGTTDGVLLDGDGAIAKITGDIALFWRHLSAAGMIAGSYDGVTTSSTVGVTFPAIKLGTNGIGVYGVSGINYYQMGATAAGTNAATYSNTTLSPLQAYNIDSKLDNGRPFDGIVTGVGGTSANGAVLTGASATARCVNAANIGAYSATSTYEFGAGDNKLCQIRIKMN